MNIQQMMKQAQQMQERLQKQMAELRIEATAGGGMVTVIVNGAKQLQSLTTEEKRDLRRTSLKGVGLEVAEQPLAAA